MKAVKNKKISSQTTEIITTKIEDTTLKQKEIETEEKKKKYFFSKIGFGIIFTFLVLFLFLFILIFTPNLTLNGDSTITISYQDTYRELGAEASYLNQDVTDKIVITNDIEDGKVGTYHVTYQVKGTLFKVVKRRTVRIIDSETPTITLEGNQEVSVCPGSKFVELGYRAFDEYDGDITDKVTVEEKDNLLTYSVTDSSNNTFSITRKILYQDSEKPIITLKGNQTIYLSPSDTFTEPGYTASDNCNSDLTDKVVVIGKVEEGKIGTYTLKYEVVDDNDNLTTIERTVIVASKTDPNSGEIKKGTIYLTFDDGPSSKTTATILDILKEEGVKATFFVTNKGPDELIQRMYDEGHTVALHTASHNYASVYASDEAYFKDLKKVSDRVERITGQVSKIVRFPGGSSNTVSKKYSKGIMTRLSKALLNQGYRYYDWNVDSGDASSAKTKEAVYQNVMKGLSKNKANVVLMHDIKTQTRDALRDIIQYGKENGYTFERIDMNTHMVRHSINN